MWTVGANRCEVANRANGVIYLYRAGNACDRVRQLNLLLCSAAERARAKEAALAAAKETFCWEEQAPKLVNGVEAALRLARILALQIIRTQEQPT